MEASDERRGWEIASYVVTVIGLPLAIGVFLLEQRRERRNEEDEVYQLLSDAYNDFLRVAIDNPDLHCAAMRSRPIFRPSSKNACC